MKKRIDNIFRLLIKIIFNLFLIFLGVITYFTDSIKYLGFIIIILVIISILIDIFSKDIRLISNNFIEKEKNIEIRKRFEMRNQRSINLLFALIIYSAFLSSKTYPKGLGISFYIIIFIFYYLYDKVFLEKYMNYTDQLINK